MQADHRLARAVSALHPPQKLTRRDILAAPNGSGHRLVLGADAVGVQQHDDPAPGHRSGEADHARRGGEHRRPVAGRQVDAEVPRAVLGSGRPELRHYPQDAGQRSAISRHGVGGTGSNGHAAHGLTTETPTGGRRISGERADRQRADGQCGENSQ